MSIDKNLEKFLETQGFKRENDGYLVLSLRKGSDRHQTEVWIENGLFCFGKHFMSGFDYINESEIIGNHNDLSTNTKTHWLSIKKNLLDKGYEVRVADKFTGLEVKK
ncbi:hypothetical protein KCG48_10615 [Proteiniclasticum sp. BAD-10]|uniref:Uncharacterized protein n=1 Tax=Proteiniclasticum sediminis TaxID=2804028 RepID=A0A941CQ11_9CLOT|nr:hypothetical protein [Proteiniclasticum sediminis]MBR0576785.1 hypothetical protein [Proteiniclasticum sediminis]